MNEANKPTSTKPQVRQSEFVTREEAANMLAVSTQLVDKLRRNGELPSVNVGRCVRIRRSAIEAMLREATSCN
jgi:excisionase family DNA binding protein